MPIYRKSKKILLFFVLFLSALLVALKYLPKKSATLYRLTENQIISINEQLTDSEKLDGFVELGANRLFCIIGELQKEEITLPNAEKTILTAPCTYKKQDGVLETINLIVSLNFDNQRTGIVISLPEITPQLDALSSSNIITFQSGYRPGTKTLVYFGLVTDENIGFQSASFLKQPIDSMYEEKDFQKFIETGNPGNLYNGYLLPIVIGYNID